MKLPIKKKYFDLIKKGEKIQDLRDAHITFICEETGEQLRKNIDAVGIFERSKSLYPDVLSDDYYIKFEFEYE